MFLKNMHVSGCWSMTQLTLEETVVFCLSWCMSTSNGLCVKDQGGSGHHVDDCQGHPIGVNLWNDLEQWQNALEQWRWNIDGWHAGTSTGVTLEHRRVSRWNIDDGTSTDVTLEHRRVLRWNIYTGTSTGVTLEHRHWNIDGCCAGTSTGVTLEHRRWNIDGCLNVTSSRGSANFSVQWSCRTGGTGSILTGDR